MWYFTWILGLGLALGFGVINVMWLEASYAFGDLDEGRTQDRFVSRSRAPSRARSHRAPTDAVDGAL